MPYTINDIRKKLIEQTGNPVKLTAYESRNRVTEHVGVLSNTYPSIFIIDLDTTPESVARVSYNYSDILTGDIELTFN